MPVKETVKEKAEKRLRVLRTRIVKPDSESGLIYPRTEAVPGAAAFGPPRTESPLSGRINRFLDRILGEGY